MKAPLLLLAILCAYPLAPAQAQKRLDLRPAQEKVEDPGSATPLLFKNPNALPPAAAEKPSGLKISQMCTDSMGMTHKKGDRGYEACLRNLDRYRPEPRASEKNPHSVGITIGQ